jgi:hypothetical protein
MDRRLGEWGRDGEMERGEGAGAWERWGGCLGREASTDGAREEAFRWKAIGTRPPADQKAQAL